MGDYRLILEPTFFSTETFIYKGRKFWVSEFGVDVFRQSECTMRHTR
jgi:hypothetical protein